MYRFVREPRWIALILLVPVAVALCIWLSNWQWNRHLGRDVANTELSQNLAEAAIPVDQVVEVGQPLRSGLDQRAVAATGIYDTSAEFLVRKRPLAGSNGYWVVTPLITPSGAALLVNRGWLKANGSAAATPEIPVAPPGLVTLNGRLRSSESGPQQEPSDVPVGQVSALDANRAAAVAGRPTYSGYVDLVSSNPPQASGLTPIPQPEVGQGSHLSYSMQWIVFAIIFLVGLVLLIRREALMRKEVAAPIRDKDGLAPDFQLTPPA